MRFKAVGVLAAVAAMSLGAGIGPAAAKKKHARQARQHVHREQLQASRSRSRVTSTWTVARTVATRTIPSCKRIRYRNKTTARTTPAHAVVCRSTASARVEVKLRFKNLKRCTNKHTKGGKTNKKSEVYRKVTIKAKHGPIQGHKRFNEKLGCG